ncbi:hypothetical protein C8T65DRAFT_635132 [Cerioporus squamosus]|nr:hypothetical protein C8T65DRAFT_635132 [Cerioporus squamosus]
MPHTFLPVRFDPARSAYWLPAHGQRTAARMRTDWFWALRISFQDPANHEANATSADPCPPWLFVVASTPSPYPNVPKASFTLGPREADDTGTIVGRDSELLVKASDGPLPSLERLLQEPLFLHTVPALRLHMNARPPLDVCYFALEEESLRAFVSGALESIHLAEQYREDALERYGYDAVKNGWAAPTTDAGRMRFGEGLNDPHAYVFDLECPRKIPCLERPSFVYEELMLYRQLCVDYRWKGVEPALDWVQNMRQVSASSSSSSMSSWGAESFALTWPQLPYNYPLYPFTKPRIIAFDLFGTILDRQGAITRGVFVVQSRVPTMRSMDINTLVERFITLEALAARRSREAELPTSLATLARMALIDLLEELDLHISEHDPLFVDALKHILRPEPYADVEHVVATLLQRGYKLVCLPVQSETTMQQLRPYIPDVFTNNATLWTRYVSPHVTADRKLFKGFAAFCGTLVGRTERLPYEDCLVVGASIGRVLHVALCHHFTAVLVRRPGNLEGNVDFVVGTVKRRSTPVPSLIVSGLDELCAQL